RVGAAGLHGEVGLVELLVRLGLGAFDVVLDVGRARRAQASRNRLAVEVLDALDVVIVGGHAHDEAGFVVGIGEVDGFLALVGDADAGDGEVEGSGLEPGMIPSKFVTSCSSSNPASSAMAVMRSMSKPVYSP